MSTLYQLTGDALALNQLIEEYAEANEGDITNIGDIVDAWIKENADSIEKKVDGYVSLIREKEALAEVRLKESARYANLAKTDKNLAERLKERLREHMDLVGNTHIETENYKISTAGNGGKQPMKVDDIDPNVVPLKFQKISVDFDKDSIRQHLAEGGELEWARLEERGRTLRIK